MKTKKLFLTIIFLAITIIAYVAASVFFCYTTKPEVTTGKFPFSITYEYKGETKTLSGVFECEYSGSDTKHGEHSRYWNGETKYDNPGNVENPYIIEKNDELQTTLTIQENMSAGYFMGDPLHKDYYKSYGLEGVEPHIEYYDYKNNVSLSEENQDEILESIGFKIVDFTYAEPIENSFSFSGISYGADNIIIFVAITLVFFLLCLIFVHKDKNYQPTKLDKAGIILNFIIGLLAIPFITFFCMSFSIIENNIEIINQITYNIPSFAIICLALSVVFRRKGFSKPGFIIQFVGILPFVFILIEEALS